MNEFCHLSFSFFCYLVFPTPEINENKKTNFERELRWDSIQISRFLSRWASFLISHKPLQQLEIKKPNGKDTKFVWNLQSADTKDVVSSLGLCLYIYTRREGKGRPTTKKPSVSANLRFQTNPSIFQRWNEDLLVTFDPSYAWIPLKKKKNPSMKEKVTAKFHSFQSCQPKFR